MIAFLITTTCFGASVGNPAPEITRHTREGTPLNIGKLQGQVVLVNFWASWCEPCRNELPELEKLYREQKDKQFTIVGINIDKRPENADKFIKEFNLSYPIILDPEAEVIKQFQAKAMPTSYLIDRAGVIKKVFYGYSAKKLPAMKNDIVALINE